MDKRPTQGTHTGPKGLDPSQTQVSWWFGLAALLWSVVPFAGRPTSFPIIWPWVEGRLYMEIIFDPSPYQ